jgi:hypothetical protein
VLWIFITLKKSIALGRVWICEPGPMASTLTTRH